ncbi:MAG TPA: hypothetical protein VF042_15760, partial [Gemmatimonadaceae bacterium]
MTSLVFVNAAQVVTCAGPGRARRGKEAANAAVIENAAVAVKDDTIIAVGPHEKVMRQSGDAEQVDCRG